MLLVRKIYFFGLKSHDFYNILRYHLSISISGLLTPIVEHLIFRLSRYIRLIYMHKISQELIMKLKKEGLVVFTLQQMQMPTSFFDGQ